MSSVVFGVGIGGLGACAGKTRYRGQGGAGSGKDTGGEAEPEVTYTGPSRPIFDFDKPVELLFAAPALPESDIGTIRVTCAQGCRYSAVRAAIAAKARAVGASGVHDLAEVSGNVAGSLEQVAKTNRKVYLLAGTVFVYK